MKRILICLFALAASVCCLLVAGAWWLEHSYLPGKIASASFYGQPVRMEGKPIVQWLPPKLILNKCAWDGEANGLAAAFSARQIGIEPNIRAFLASRLELTEISLEQPVIYLEKSAATPKDNNSPAKKPPVPANLEFGIERLVANAGSLRYVDNDRDFKLENLRLAGHNIRPRQEIGLQCDFGLVARQGAFAVSGNVALKTLVRYYAPNLTFRDGSVTFTATRPEGLKNFSPCQAQFDGAINLASAECKLAAASILTPFGRLEISGESEQNSFAGKALLELEMAKAPPFKGILSISSPFMANGRIIEARNAEMSWGGFSAVADLEIFLENSGPVAAMSAQAVDGNINIKLNRKGVNYDLAATGKDLSLGELLRQMGINGFAGGKTALSANITLPDDENSLVSAKGQGKLECGKLELEPFGEMSLLLPLLGHSGALMPKALDKLNVAMSLSNGKATLAPINGIGPQFVLNGETVIDLASGDIDGKMLIKALGLDLPFVFDGPISSPSLRIDPALLKR